MNLPDAGRGACLASGVGVEVRPVPTELVGVDGLRCLSAARLLDSVALTGETFTLLRSPAACLRPTIGVAPARRRRLAGDRAYRASVGHRRAGRAKGAGA